MAELPPDPVIDEIRAIRKKISAEFGHDSSRLMEFYLQLQEKYSDRLLGRTPELDSNVTPNQFSSGLPGAVCST